MRAAFKKWIIFFGLGKKALSVEFVGVIQISVILNPAASPLFPTIITTQLGFEEWGCFLQDIHMTTALLDRCHGELCCF